MGRIGRMIDAHNISRGYIRNLCRKRSDPESPIRYDASKTEEDIENAYFAAVLAGLTYRTQAELEKELLSLGYVKPNLLCFNHKLSSGFITEWGDVIAISFCGSKSASEWINNFKVWFAVTPYGRIHAGFYETIEKIGPTLFQTILPGLLSGSKIILTGHSRGGAIATLFGGFLMLNGYIVQGVYTFGAPRIGDKKFAKFMNGEWEE